MSESKTELQEFVDDLRANGNMPEELVEIFAEESEDHLKTITDGLDRLRVDHNDMEAIGDIPDLLIHSKAPPVPLGHQRLASLLIAWKPC